MLAAEEIDEVLRACLPDPVWELYRVRGLGGVLARYLDLLSRWNKVAGLTSVRDEREMVRRHIAEGLCCAAELPGSGKVLDLGSGAGVPGIPIQLMWPELGVTLAEAQRKKAAFLREVVRELDLPARVHAGRAQELPKGAFGSVCLRAVDPMEQALVAAAELASGLVCILGSAAMEKTYGAGLEGWELSSWKPSIEGGSTIYLYRGAPLA